MQHYAEDHFRSARLTLEPGDLQLGVIIPTLNEDANILVLLDRLRVALTGIAWEAIFVDDGSTDGTIALLTEIAARDPHIHLIRRYGRRGLSSAVVEGMLASAAPVLAVIDADLQHDERLLPDLFAIIGSGQADLAIGTRYANSGSTGDWQESRALISRFATALATRMLRTAMSDPMSGFFAISRGAFLASLPHLSGVGYKLLLDLVASAPRPLRVAERPYHFRRRIAGESKLDTAIALQFGTLLLDKTVGRYIPPRFLMFIAVGSFGVLVHLAVLGLLVDMLHLSFRVAQTVAVLTAMTVNFCLNNRFTYRDRRLRGIAFGRGLLSFYLVCSIGAVANIGVGTLIYSSDHRWWLAGVAGAALSSVWNYAASSLFTWSNRAAIHKA
ncbi:glycosyltransferase family 2 protein [soil metagenome]